MFESNTSLTSLEYGELLLFKTLWNNSTDNMFVVRLDDNGDFINESCNSAQAKSFNSSVEELEGIHLKEVLDESCYLSISIRYNQCLSLNRAISYDENAVIDGELRYFNTTILPIVDDNYSRIFGIARETTALVKKEQEKLLLEQRKNAQILEMVDNIAHQWRQPLSAISTAASTIQMYKDMDISQEFDEKELLDIIVKETKYLSNTIDDLREYAKEEKELTDIIVQERLQIIINQLKASLENYNIQLRENYHHSEPIKLKMVIGEFSEVISSLIHNAKEILIEKKIVNPLIKLELIKKENSLVITIEDNGGGIDQNDLPKVFDLYFTTKHKSKGKGLGLYTCKTIIERHLNGSLSAHNGKDGAVFTIELPFL